MAKTTDNQTINRTINSAGYFTRWDVFPGEGPITQSEIISTFVRLADAKHFIAQGFSYQDMQRDILGVWKRKKKEEA